MQYVCFTCIGVSSLVGRVVCLRLEHIILPTRLLTTTSEKTYHIACLPKDEPTRFETSRRQKLNINLENYAFHWFVLHNYITMPGTKKNGWGFPNLLRCSVV